MAKGIIAIDIPETCGMCRFRKSRHCRISGDVIYNLGAKLKSCPIQPVTVISGEYEQGWNACIDEIFGGSDE